MLKIIILTIFNMKYIKMAIGPVWKYISPIFKYILDIFTALSQLANAILFGNIDQTFAARCHEGALLNITWSIWMERLLNILWSGIELGHCKISFNSDVERSYSKVDKLTRFEAFKNELGMKS